MRVLGVLLLSLLGVALADFDFPQERHRRFAAQQCTIAPDSNVDKVIDKNQPVKLTCNLDANVQSCVWTHFEPQKEGQSSTADPDIICSAATGDSGKPCDTDSRITYIMSTNQCGISISNTKPEDTGKWKLIAMGLSPTLTPQTAQKDFEVFTYNISTVKLSDSRDNPIRTIDTTYNYDVKNQRWETGKGDYESVEFKCQAYGGRPRPQFIWYIENNNNDPLTSNTDGFQISEISLGSTDRYGYISSYESRITFRIDDKLFTRLQKHSINTNPMNGIVSFEVRCDVMQGLISSSERPSVRINVKKTYDDGNLTAGTIGIIIGVVIAVILLVVAVALLIFAKSSGRWCFADEEAYRQPETAKPRTAGATSSQPAQRQQRRH